MASSDTETEQETVEIIHGNLGEITLGSVVHIAYQSNRGNKKRKETSGKVTSVTPKGDREIEFQFYDEDLERKVKVQLQRSLEESSVRSMKTDSWHTIGSPVLVIAGDGFESAELLHQQYLLDRRESKFPLVKAAAKIGENKSELKWLMANSSAGV